jgi:hypothetical protein
MNADEFAALPLEIRNCALEKYYEHCLDLDHDDPLPDPWLFLEGYWGEENYSPDDLEDGEGTLTPPECLGRSALIVNHFKQAAGGQLLNRGIAEKGGKGLFEFIELQTTQNSYIGTIHRGGEFIGRVKINLDDDCHYEVGGDKFLGILVRILNGQDKDPQLRRFRPSDFGFFFIKEGGGFKVGRKDEEGTIACKLWGYHIHSWPEENLRVLQKAVARALNRVGLEELEKEKRPTPTRKLQKPHGKKGNDPH